MEVKEKTEATAMDPLLDLASQFHLKCRDVGKLRFDLTMLDRQRKEIEKTLEIAERDVGKIARQHDELKEAREKSKASPTPEAPTLELATH